MSKEDDKAMISNRHSWFLHPFLNTERERKLIKTAQTAKPDIFRYVSMWFSR